MFFWFVYYICSLYISYILSAFFPSRIRTFILFLVLAILLTPESMGLDSQKPTPVLFSFIFQLIFEQSISIRTLRPLVFSLPLAFTLAMLVLGFKKRFSQI
tara:strand:+ start:7803 stop:8105 length:303 start_codon:yes stop_codon:yes gene_type:complete